MKYIMHRYESIHQFVDAANAAKDGGGSSSSTDGTRWGGNWHGTKNFAESVNYAKYGGWNPPELLQYRDIFEALMPKLRKFVADEFVSAPDVSGYEVNMQAYLDGEPECMFEWMPDEHQIVKRALCITIGCSISGGVDSEEVFIRGQAAIALVRALSLLGYELEIWSELTVGCRYGVGEGQCWSGLVRLHAAGSTMDESAVEFAIGNPSWLRRLMFGLQEGESAKVRKDFGFENGSGYGTVNGIHHADLVGAEVQLDLGRSWFSAYDPKSAAENGMKWVVSQLKELGVIDADREVEWD